MRVTTNPREIEDLKSSRCQEIRRFPDEWADTALDIDPRYEYTIGDPVSIRTRSVFGHSRMTVGMSPYSHERTRIPYLCYKPRDGQPGQFIPFSLEDVQPDSHKINLGGVRYTEHPMAFMQGLGLKVNWMVTEDSFPLLKDSIAPYIDAVKPILVRKAVRTLMTVPEPTAVITNRGGYAIFEPSQGEDTLTLDHQISYPKNFLGTKRFRECLTPQFISGIAQARSPAFDVNATIMTWLSRLGIHRLPGHSYSTHNLVGVSAHGLLNPKPKFDHQGDNLEVLAHEVIDRISALPFAEFALNAKLVGTMTTYRIGHAHEVNIAQLLCRGEIQTVLGT